MNTIKLNTSRDKTFVGFAMPYRIINGIEMQNEYRKQNVFRTAKNTINIKPPIMKTSPLPPKEKHLETVIHVYELRQRAKTLLEKGKRQLNEAKQGGERMILSGIGICL